MTDENLPTEDSSAEQTEVNVEEAEIINLSGLFNNMKEAEERKRKQLEERKKHNDAIARSLRKPR